MESNFLPDSTSTLLRSFHKCTKPTNEHGRGTLLTTTTATCTGEEFVNLDAEIERYEYTILNSKPLIEDGKNKSNTILGRIMNSIKSRFFQKSIFSTEPPLPPPLLVPLPILSQASSANEPVKVTCRLCEQQFSTLNLECHTEWCSRYQDCMLKRASSSRYFEILSTALVAFIDDDGQSLNCKIQATKILQIVDKASTIDESTGGRMATISLAKLLYKLAKIDSSPGTGIKVKVHLKRAKYLVEQKRVLSERFTDLKMVIPEEVNHELSSLTDSSLESTPKRPSTPVARLTTLLVTMLKGPRPSSRSPQFGTSPPRPSMLRSSVCGTTIPKISDFEIIKPVSKGAYGKVYLARKKTTNDLFAIKALSKSDLIRKNMTSHVLTERRVMSLAQAPFVVMLYYAFESRHHLFLVMEYLIGGDFSSVLQERGRLPEPTAKFYIAELVLALEYLHDNGIIHRDIKPDNLLLGADGHLRLTDFGLADFKSQGTKSIVDDRILGTPDYLAPEILLHADHGTAVDWWAVGVCLFEFLIGFPPFTGESPCEIFDKILGFHKINWEEYEQFGISNEAKDLIDHLLDVEPDTRLGSQSTKSHCFFNGIDWDRLRDSPAPLQPQTSNNLDTSHFEARNRRYEAINLPDDFLDAEPVDGPTTDYSFQNEAASTSSTPTRGLRRTSSPFDGFVFKNIDLLSRVNRLLSVTPTSFTSSPGELIKASSASLGGEDHHQMENFNSSS